MIKIGHDSQAYKDIKALYKNNRELILCDDFNSLEIALKYNYEIEVLLTIDDDNFFDETKALIDKLDKKAKSSYKTSKKLFEAFLAKDNSIGVIAFVKPLKYSLDYFKDKEFIVVTDRLEIPGNLGTILRTMDSTKCDGLIMVDPVTKLINNKMSQLARGANLTIPCVSVSYDEAQKFLLENGFDIFLGEPELGLDYQEYDYKGKIAIVVGNERFGINKKWYDNKSSNVYIPMEGNNNSLNVAVAASILIYEAYMKRKKR